MQAKGTVFKYGDNVDTDVIIPARYLAIADKKELAEEYARKKGYVMPDERVYVDITPGSAE